MLVNYYMKKNKFVFLAFLLICICARGVLAQTNTNWRVAEFDGDFIGRWEGRVRIPIHEDREAMMPESSIDLTLFLEYLKYQGSESANFRVSMKLDMEKFFNDFLNLPEVRSFGFTLETLWELFISDFKSMDALGSGIGVQKYSISYSISESVDEFYNNSTMGTIFLNDDNTRMKLIFNEAIDTDFGGDGSITEIILNKTG